MPSGIPVRQMAAGPPHITAPEGPELVTSFHRYAVVCAALAGRGWPWLWDDFESDCLPHPFRTATRHTGTDSRLYLATALHRTINARVRHERGKNPAAFTRRRRADDEDLDALALLADHRADGREAVDVADRLVGIDPDTRAAAAFHHAGARAGRRSATFSASPGPPSGSGWGTRWRRRGGEIIHRSAAEVSQFR